MQRSLERARHGSYLVVKRAPDDLGSRPLTSPFASPGIQVTVDGRPQVTIWNLGNREVEGVITEFYSIPAGLPVRPENAQLIGLGNTAIIPAREPISITCNQTWRRFSHADVLLVMAYHAELDPVRHPYDPLHDRHVGQMNYPWAGVFQGTRETDGIRIRLELRPVNQGLFRVKLFEETNGWFPSFPKCDRVIKANQHTFRWLEVEANRKELHDLAMLDNDRIHYTLTLRPLEGSELRTIGGHGMAAFRQVTGVLQRALA